MTTQVERPYSIMTDHLKLQDTLKMKTPLSGSLSFYQQYIRGLEKNTDLLKDLFQEQTKDELRQLLMQLDNNLEMAVEILKQNEQKPRETQPQKCLNEQVEIKEREVQKAPESYEEKLNWEKARADEATRQSNVLKRAYWKLTQKLSKEKQEKEALLSELLIVKSELNKAMLRFREQLEDEFAEKININNTDIC